jgi:hypothetical protein
MYKLLTPPRKLGRPRTTEGAQFPCKRKWITSWSGYPLILELGGSDVEGAAVSVEMYLDQARLARRSPGRGAGRRMSSTTAPAIAVPEPLL